MQEERKRITTIRSRAFIIGFILAALICAFTPFNNAYRNASPLGGGYFPLAPFYILLMLSLITGISRRFFKNVNLFSGSELILIWGFMILTSGIAYTGFARTFFINLTAPFYFASVENRWKDVIQPLLPKNLFPQDFTAIETLYNGIEGGQDMGFFQLAQNIPWAAWILPFISWGVFMIICYFFILCFVHMISKQAIERERMNFPLLIVPKMIQKAFDEKAISSFFGNKFLLMGICIPFFIHMVNGLNFYFPSFPHINTLVLAGSYFPKQGIFTGFIKLKLYFYPAFIGFAFLASKQVSFSFWFFFLAGALFTGVLTVLGMSFPASELGITFGPTLSRPEETQMLGAFIVFAIFLLWVARFHLFKTTKNAFDFKNLGSDPAHIEDILVFWGTITGFIMLVAWFCFHGVGLIQTVTLLVFFLLFTMIAMRVICQGGVTYFTLTIAPLDAINTIFGLKIFSSLGLMLAAISQKVMFVDLRESVAPSILHTLRISDRIKGPGIVALSIMSAMIMCLAISAIAMIFLCYKYGIRELQLDWATRTTVSVYNNLFPLIESQIEQGDSIKWFALAGAVIMCVIVTCYHRFYWWPLHPIGYLMIYSSAMKILWLSFFLGWFFNALCMRYGGIVLFKKFRYFFAGLIVGDFLMGGTFAIIGFFTEYGYQVLPN